MGMPRAPLSYKARGSGWEKRCQKDIFVCKGGPKTLRESTVKIIHKACASSTDSHCDRNLVVLSGNTSGTRQRQADLHLRSKDEASYQGKRDSAEFDPHCVGDVNLLMHA